MTERELRRHFKAFGIVYTRQRAAVYRCMAEQGVPLTAAAIAARLTETEGADERTWLSTVYRSLELFAERGLAHPFRLPEGEALAYHLSPAGHHHYAFCTGCKKMLDLGCPAQSIHSKLRELDFAMEEHRIEIYGRCRDCRAKRKDPRD